MAAIKFLSKFIPEQISRTPAPPTRSFSGETVIITGSNTGLGKDAARQIVALGALRVILAVRTLTKGEEAKLDIESQTGRKGVVEVWQLDLASYDSVKAFATRCDALPRIDAVIENAGIWTSQYKRAEDNESTITVNVISTVLLALLLLPKLRESARLYNTRPRLSIVSSQLFEIAPLKAKRQPQILDYMNDERTADMEGRYYDSKLLEVLYFIPFIKRQEEVGSNREVVVNTVNPGWCASELSRESDGGADARGVKAMLIRTTEEGARCLVYGAGAGPETHGQFMSSGSVRDISCTWPHSKQGREVGNKIFAQVNEKLEGIYPGVTRNI